MCKSSNSQKYHKCNICRWNNKKRCIYKKHTLSQGEAIIGANCWHISVEDSIEGINSKFRSRPMQLICKFSCFSTSNGLNTSINFSLIDTSNPKLYPSLCLFITQVWFSLLKHYPGALRLYLVILLRQITLLGYKKPEANILSLNQISTIFDLKKLGTN